MSDAALTAEAINALTAKPGPQLQLRECYYRRLGWDISGKNGDLVKVTGVTDSGCNYILISVSAANTMGEQILPLIDNRPPQLVLQTIVPKCSITPIGFIPKVTVESPDLSITFSEPCYVVDLVDFHLIIGLRAQGKYHITEKMDSAIRAGVVPKYLGNNKVPDNVVAIAQGGHARDGRSKKLIRAEEAAKGQTLAEERDDVANDMKQNGHLGLYPGWGGSQSPLSSTHLARMLPLPLLPAAEVRAFPLSTHPMAGMGGWAYTPQQGYAPQQLCQQPFRQGCPPQVHPPMPGFAPSPYYQHPNPLSVSRQSTFGSMFSVGGTVRSVQLLAPSVYNENQPVRQQDAVPATSPPTPGMLSPAATFASDATTATDTTAPSTVFSAASDASSVLSAPTIHNQKPGGHPAQPPRWH